MSKFEVKGFMSSLANGITNAVNKAKSRVKVVAVDKTTYKGIMSLFLKDYYKAVHSEMLPQGMTKSVSYYTPRKSRVRRWDKVVVYGVQAFIKTWLIDGFQKNFFDLPEDYVVSEYQRVLDNTMGKGIYDIEKVRKLHRLGYLPIEIVSLPEGMQVPMRVPIFGITNTHDDFAWLPQALESLISAECWYPMVCATVGHTYREIVNKYYDLTCDDDIPRRRALGNFDFRGDAGVDAALKAAGGWLLSFVNTATVPSIPYMEQNYNCDCTNEEVGFGAISSEHFVMCSNFAVDGDERTFIKRCLTELYPKNPFSLVLDSYDYWRIIDEVLPTLKDEILNHEGGPMLVRGDSGVCVDVVTTTVFKLWDIFGGTVNSKGYKVLDPHIKAIYGDAITVERAEKIYKILMDHGFAANCVSLGVGSFSMHCIEEDGALNPFTRDTFGVAIKACYAEINNKSYNIFKDPKTDRESGDNMKKSHKGCCRVTLDEATNELVCTDGLTWNESMVNNLMVPIFRDGVLLKEYTLDEIRQTLNDGNF